METQRFVLSPAELSEAFAAAGRIPQEGDFPDGLPAASGFLPAAAGAGGELDPALRRILDTIARSDISLRIDRANGCGAGAAESCTLRIRDNCYVAFARSGSGYQLVLVGNRAALLALIDELTGEACESFSEAIAAATASTTRHDADSGICGRCGTLYGNAQAFCRECGNSLGAPE